MPAEQEVVASGQEVDVHQSVDAPLERPADQRPLEQRRSFGGSVDVARDDPVVAVPHHLAHCCAVGRDEDLAVGPLGPQLLEGREHP